MTNTTITEMMRLREGLAAEPVGIEAELTTFPSGSAMLDVRRAGHAFVMAYTPKDGFGVDELNPDDGFVTGYRFVFKDFEPAARQLRAMAVPEIPTESPSPALSLVVLQSGDVQASKDFYSLLGLSFVEEQHGTGPRHYSTTLGALVLEIYPCQGSSPSAPVRIGFRVPSLDQTLDVLRSRGARIVREAKDSPWGRRAIVEDPDGNRVELASTDLKRVEIAP
ncbi:MAG TPA: VOC family protein [Gemmataceae bacterium]|jgi:lactoylglutathione lyase|nr:VOC family protein [Gemmataceae bacterium]